MTHTFALNYESCNNFCFVCELDKVTTDPGIELIPDSLSGRHSVTIIATVFCLKTFFVNKMFWLFNFMYI